MNDKQPISNHPKRKLKPVLAQAGIIELPKNDGYAARGFGVRHYHCFVNPFHQNGKTTN
ncbi:MAG: hypothetical protein ACKVZH_16690 [Blastocatellia bacterium]